MKVALAAERSQAAHLDNIAGFWSEWINEEEVEEPVTLRRGHVTSQRQPNIKSTIIYEKEDDIAKVHSMDESHPDPDLDLLEPPLRANKSLSTAADSNDLDLQDQQHLPHKQHKVFKDSYYCEGGKLNGEESMPEGEVVINAKPAGVVAPAARAEMF